MKRQQTSSLPLSGGVYLVALGCPKNFVDSEVIAGTLAAAGYPPVPDPEEAVLYVVNTCAFLPQARAEAKRELDAACRWKEEDPRRRKVIAAGCLPEYDRKRGDAKRDFPAVDLWLRADDIARLPELLGGAVPAADDASPAWIYNETTPRMILTLPHLGGLKIADGCCNRCSYCSIPDIRGALRSRSITSVLREAKQLLDCGVREITLLAQDITAFGHDTGESLAELLRKLDALPGDFVMRLLYTHPAHYTDELVDVLAGAEKVLPYLDIPLQHISDPILKAMNRHTTRAATEALIARLRERIPGLTLRTTFITGLPGEGEKEFAELAEFIRDVRFERMGVFTFAPEPGTPAAAMKGQVPAAVAEERAQLLMRRQTARMRRFHKTLIGKKFRTMIDMAEGDWAIGRSSMDAPEIDNRILLPRRRGVKAGEFHWVEITGTRGNDLLGKAVKR